MNEAEKKGHANFDELNDGSIDITKFFQSAPTGADELDLLYRGLLLGRRAAETHESSAAYILILSDESSTRMEKIVALAYIRGIIDLQMVHLRQEAERRMEKEAEDELCKHLDEMMEDGYVGGVDDV